MTASTPPERPAKKMQTTIWVPVKLRDELAEIAAEERARTGGSVAFHAIIQQLLDDRRKRKQRNEQRKRK